MRTTLLGVAAILAAGLSGCVLPVPHVTKACGPISGTVVDARTGQPIESAVVQVRYPSGALRTVETDARGEFGTGSKYRFHYALVVSPALCYSLPHNIHPWQADLLVQTPGYRPVSLVLPPMDMPGADPPASPVPAGPARGDGWHIPTIPLTTAP